MGACRSEGGRAIVVMLRGVACGVTERRPGAFDSLRVREADARCKDVPEEMWVECCAERALRQLGLSIGAQSGPRIGIQEGPHLSTL